MAIPNSRDTFKQFCLRQLGGGQGGVIDVNMSDEQIDDCIDLALKFFADYHYDGSDVTYYKILIDDALRTNGYVVIPENIIGVVDLFRLSSTLTSPGIWNAQYQIVMTDMLLMGGVTIAPYYMSMQNLSLMADILVGATPLRYNRHENKLHIDLDWSVVTNGEYIVAKCYMVIDPDTYTDVWGDRWLARYCVALMKRVWGNNLKKFKGMKLPGGLEFNGQEIYNEAVQEIDELERDMIRNLSYPPIDQIGD